MLFHSTTNESVLSILEKGVQKKNIEHKFAEPEMGEEGLHLSSEGGSYLDDERTDLIVFELAHNMEGIKTLSYQEFLRNSEVWKLNKEKIKQGYRFLSKTSPLLQRSGLTPIDTESLLVNSGDSVRIEGIIPNADPTIPIEDQEQISLQDYCEDKKISLHPMWQEKVLDKVSITHRVFKKGTERAFFKFLRNRDCMFGSEDYAFLAEIGASLLAHKLLGPLVPKAKLSYHKGKRGISQDYIEGSPLIKDPNKEKFNIKNLKSNQVHQLFAHMLVDWVLANHDNTPNQFLITTDGDLIDLDKGQSYKFFKGSKVQSQFVDMGVEKDLPEDPSFADLEIDPIINVYAKLRKAIKSKDVTVDVENTIIQKTLEGLCELNQKTIAAALGPYARLSYPGKEKDFFQSILDRAHKLPGQIQDFLN